MLNRQKRAKLNIFVSLGTQIITLLCGLIVPRLMIGAFGSEAYGATSSIAQFLAYITLLEGGIGGVARAALYKPLAENNIEKISEIISALKRFFKIIAYIFVIYVLFLAVFFNRIANENSFDWLFTFMLVCVISISTFAQYFIGISYAVLIQADQKTYITNYISVATTILNTVCIIVLVGLNCNLIIVKLVSSCVFVLRPILMWIYVKQKFGLIKCKTKGKDILPQKWTGLGQHIAFFLHSNTDIAILTVLSNLSMVAIYSVYYMIVSHIQSLTSSFSAGMEALFGDMIAKKEYNNLNKTFDYYDILISTVTVILFSSTAVLIIPFVTIYTADVADMDYIRPLFSFLLVLSSILYCVRLPYHAVVIAAGHFKQTKVAAYGEVLINVVLSIVLVLNFGLIGVAIGTLVATLFRLIYYAIYLSKNIFNRAIGLFVKRFLVNVVAFSFSYIIGDVVISVMNYDNYLSWAICGVVVIFISAIITLLINFIVYGKELISLLKKRRI